jgi:hypothetical protein
LHNSKKAFLLDASQELTVGVEELNSMAALE